MTGINYLKCQKNRPLDTHKEQIKLILDKSDLGWNKKNHRIGILFNNELMQAFLIKGK